jgi:class 3 adenylate cyclase/predicted ATPase
MDVGEWLRGLGLGQYEEKFRDNKIDLDVLPELTADDLRDIGVVAVGDRRRLLAAIATVAGVKPSSDTSSSAPEPTRSKGPQISAERRPIAVMFCDLVGSTELASRIGAEDWRELVSAYLDGASASVTEFGGHVLKRLGDGLMALFGYPAAQENDAERAVRAALAIQRVLAEINRQNSSRGAPELSARIGIESGPVVVDATGEVFGDAPNVAARVQAAAEPGSVLVTGNIQRQVAGLFVAEELTPRKLKGVSEPVHLFRIIRASSAGRRSAGRQLTPIVGRDEEIAMLVRRWDRARHGDGQLAIIVGEPGLGKSRLIAELHTRLADTPHTWVEWSCSQLLQNTPWHPIVEWGRLRFGGVDAPAERRLADLENSLADVKLDPAENVPLLAALLDIPLPTDRASTLSSEELRRRQLAALTAWVMAGARTQPIVLAVEDLHWADPTTLDVLRGIAERGSQAPLFVAATARPEFRPPWAMRSHHGVVSLAPLDRGQVREMLTELSARHALPRNVIEDVAARTGGVPLFVEELTRLLLERGAQGDAHAIPPTLQQSLTARLDRLGPAREVAQIGSVIGRDFSYELLRAVANMDEAPLQAALERLAEAEILMVQGLPPQSSYRFKHVLIQDAAYQSLLRASQKVQHRRVAETLEEQFPDTVEKRPELLAHHYTEAGLAEPAVVYWRTAGQRAAARAANIEAIDHLRRALSLLEALPKRAELADEELTILLALGPALMSTRSSTAPEIQEVYGRARQLARDAGKVKELFATVCGSWMIAFVSGKQEVAHACKAELFSIARKEDDAGYLLQAYHCAWPGELLAGNLNSAHEQIESGLPLYDKDAHRDHAVLYHGHDPAVCGYMSDALLLQASGQPDRSMARLDAGLALARELAHAPTLIHALWYAAETHFLRRDPVGVATLVAEWLPTASEFGSSVGVANATMMSGWAKVVAGDHEVGLAELRDGLDRWRSTGSKTWGSVRLGRAAAAFIEAGDADEGAALLAEAFQVMDGNGERWYEAELLRLQGAILLRSSSISMVEAEKCLERAITVARSQGARLFELRAVTALVRSPCDPEEHRRRKALLGAIYGSFTEGFDLPDFKEARSLLDEWA